MFNDILVLDEKSKDYAEKIYQYKMSESPGVWEKGIISIGGISGTRKSETAHYLAKKLYDNGMQCHIVSLDDYYRVNWNVRYEHRKYHWDEPKTIGPEEYDWIKINNTYQTFFDENYPCIEVIETSKYTHGEFKVNIPRDKINVLIFEGLYALDDRLYSNIKVNVGKTNPESTKNFRHHRGKERGEPVFRAQVVERECKAVEILKGNADLVL